MGYNAYMIKIENNEIPELIDGSINTIANITRNCKIKIPCYGYITFKENEKFALAYIHSGSDIISLSKYKFTFYLYATQKKDFEGKNKWIEIIDTNFEDYKIIPIHKDVLEAIK